MHEETKPIDLAIARTGTIDCEAPKAMALVFPPMIWTGLTDRPNAPPSPSPVGAMTDRLSMRISWRHSPPGMLG
jgi:hypothetical protein